MYYVLCNMYYVLNMIIIYIIYHKYYVNSMQTKVHQHLEHVIQVRGS